ncbi:unknown [Salmonella phage FelixO1]|uniref:Uncharacterized protein n=1 Tax=Salmonella phage Felix O1 (isolate Felix O1-VT1) TaxID=1283336 RepID=Q6KGC5_BPFO1|nr:unknown [Salmonella phage FelixO1]
MSISSCAMLFRLPFKKTFSEPERDELSINLFILSNNFCLRFLIVSFEAPFIIAAWVLPRWLISPPIQDIV